jgi:hypothetical protein
VAEEEPTELTSGALEQTRLQLRNLRIIKSQSQPLKGQSYEIKEKYFYLPGGVFVLLFRGFRVSEKVCQKEILSLVKASTFTGLFHEKAQNRDDL